MRNMSKNQPKKMRKKKGVVVRVRYGKKND